MYKIYIYMKDNNGLNENNVKFRILYLIKIYIQSKWNKMKIFIIILKSRELVIVELY